MADRERILKIRDLNISFKIEGKKVNAIRGVNLDLYKGETIAIVGESGSGKSVTTKAIMGILAKNGSIESGSIDYTWHDPDTDEKHTVDITKMTEKEIQKEIRGRKIAMVFQDPMTSLDPTMTIGKQIMEPMMYHYGTSKEEAYKKAVELLEEVGITNAEKRMKNYPHQLSGGMRQRVMIAMGQICHPQLLIADEPTTALDVTIQAQILELMKDLQKKTKMGIIFITHNLGVVADICDKVSVMYAGKIVEQGPVDDIFYKPAHPYTMGLLRSMPRVDAESYERLIPIEGSPVDMLNPPEGCPFAPRCEHCMKICLKKMPPYVEIGENHRSACWLRIQERLNNKEGKTNE